MLKGNKLKFQRGAAAKPEGEDRNHGGENRHHDGDGKAGPRKSPAFLSLVEILSKDREVLDVLVQSKRDKRAAIRLIRKLLRKQGYAPGTVVTDHLRAYSAAIRDLKLSADHERRRWKNNRAENSHQPTRRRERQMQGFKSLGSAQRFLSMHAAVYNHSNAQRHLISARSYRAARSEALLSWNDMMLAA